jgi:energy-coupling factor transporter ATP-binding protein EcfA2
MSNAASALPLAVSVDRLKKSFVAGIPGCRGSVLALRGATLSVQRGEAVVLVGPPGAGKSTLLLCMAGLLRADDGAVRWFGASTPDYPRVAYARTLEHAQGARQRLAKKPGVLLFDAALIEPSAETLCEVDCLATDATRDGTAIVLTSRTALALPSTPCRAMLVDRGVVHQLRDGATDMRAITDRVAEAGTSGASVDYPLRHL